MLAGALAATLGATAGGPVDRGGAGGAGGHAAGAAVRRGGDRAASRSDHRRARRSRWPRWGSPARSIARPTAPAGAGLALPTLAPMPIPGLCAAFRCSGPALFDQPAPTYLALLALPAVWWVLFRTRAGLALRATGEGAAMARAAGVRTRPGARGGDDRRRRLRGAGGRDAGAGPGGHVRGEDDGGARLSSRSRSWCSGAGIPLGVASGGAAVRRGDGAAVRVPVAGAGGAVPAVPDAAVRLTLLALAGVAGPARRIWEG